MRVTLTPEVSNADSPENGSSSPPPSSGYAVVPRTVLTDDRLSDRAVRVYCLLDARTTGRAVYVRVPVLAQDLGVSERTVERSLAELVALGYVVRERTRRVARTAVRNPIRAADRAKAQGARSDRFVAPDPTDLSGPSRNNSLRNKNQDKGAHAARRDPVPVVAAAGPLAEAYVLAIAQATGEPLKPTNAVKALVLKIAARGMTPAQAGEAAHSRLLMAQALRAIYSPTAFLASTVLQDLAEGTPVPQEPAPTPVPPPVAEVLPRETLDLDQRADAAVRGVAACRAALRQELDTVAPDPFDAFLAQEAANAAGERKGVGSGGLPAETLEKARTA
jgi:hypothetical protein